MSESKEAWLIAENERLTKENEQLVRDMHRIDSARQSAAQIEVLISLTPVTIVTP